MLMRNEDEEKRARRLVGSIRLWNGMEWNGRERSGGYE